MFKIRLLTFTIAYNLISITQIAYAQNPIEIANNQQQYNQQRQQELSESQQKNPNVSIDTRNYQIPKMTQLEDKTASPQCFPINNIYLAGNHADTFYFALLPYTKGKSSVLGSCMNANDINNLAKNIQNNIIAKGYVTSRVVINNQNLKAGKLVFTVIAGKIAQIKLDPKTDINKTSRPIYTDKTGNPANFAPAMTMKSGELLNIRQLEQSLENLKRVPTVEADFSITPSNKVDKAGYSDVLIDWQQPKRWRLSASVDDSGQENTGIYQGNVTLTLDNPTWYNDILNLSFGHSLDGITDDIDNDSLSYSLGYTLPIKNHLLNLSHNAYNYKQTVAGANQDYVYSGDSVGTSLNYSYLAHRDNHSKTFLKAGGFVKKQRNYIDDTEIEVQRRKTAGWTAGIAYETNKNNTQVNAELGYQRGTGAFNALTPPESLFNEGSSRVGIIKANMDIKHPFDFNKKQFVYHAKAKGQYAKKALVPADRFSIGGRYTVRGFDGKRTLSGDHGVLLRQDVSTKLGNSNQSMYFGLDNGYVQMANKEQDKLLLGHHLVGGAIGFKGYVTPLNMNYDVFAGFPVKSPKGLGDKDVVSGFSLHWGF